ncbi:MAG: hypothetical protein ACI8SE_000380 [Bacteroidia bacterium]|jgi:hypothetical protein
MKHTITVLAMLLLTTIVVAQEVEPKVIETKRVRIEIRNVNGKIDTIVNEEMITVEDIDGLELDIDTGGAIKMKRIIRINDEEDMEDIEVVLVEEFEEEEVEESTTPKFVETSMWVMDLGINNWISGNSVDLPAPYEDLKLENMSAAFHLGIIQQGVNLYRGHLRFVYGIGIEFNNYRFKEGVTITPDSKPLEYEVDDVISYKRNKIVSRYATVPLMLNFKSNPGDDDKSFKLAAGIQAGYLIGAHQKQKWGENNKKEKKKVKGDYGFEDYRIGYVAQFGYGDLVIFGKYYPTNTFKSGRGPEVNTGCVGLVLTPF